MSIKLWFLKIFLFLDQHTHMQPNLLDILSKETLQDIAYSLDRLNKCKEEYWRLLVPLLPKELYHFDEVDVEKLALVGTKNGSPSLKLLQQFQRKGMKLPYFKRMLQIIECQGALDCFKKPSEFYTEVKFT